MSAPTIARPAVAAYVWDGITFDLAHPLVDVHGTVWQWLGEWTAGEPLMRPDDGLTPLAFPDLYRDLVPLRPRLPRLRSGLGALLPDLAATDGPRCAVCRRSCTADSAHCSPACRNLDDPHDVSDREADNEDAWGDAT